MVRSTFCLCQWENRYCSSFFSLIIYFCDVICIPLIFQTARALVFVIVTFHPPSSLNPFPDIIFSFFWNQSFDPIQVRCRSLNEGTKTQYVRWCIFDACEMCSAWNSQHSFWHDSDWCCKVWQPASGYCALVKSSIAKSRWQTFKASCFDAIPSAHVQDMRVSVYCCSCLDFLLVANLKFALVR